MFSKAPAGDADSKHDPQQVSHSVYTSNAPVIHSLMIESFSNVCRKPVWQICIFTSHSSCCFPLNISYLAEETQNE